MGIEAENKAQLIAELASLNMKIHNPENYTVKQLEKLLEQQAARKKMHGKRT